MIDSIIKGFDVWTDAKGVKSKGRVKSIDNISLEGITQLRKLILHFAFSGKLTSQEEGDEPAEILVDRLLNEKEKLRLEGELKKNKNSKKLTDSEFSHELPNTWIWTNLGSISKQITDGTHFTPKYVNEGIKFLSVKDISSGEMNFNDTKFISKEEHEELIKRCKPERNDILFCRIGTLGVPVIVETDEPFSIFVSLGLIKFFPNYVLPQYLKLVLESPQLWTQYMKVKAGGSHTEKLNLRDVPNLVIPIAPLEEQKRIVAKVNELMSLCDKLEEEQTNNLATHHHLVKCLLETLTQANDADELQVSWEKISQHFDILFCTEDSVEQLKQTLLELVISGRFKTQRDSDTPVSVTFEKIQEELSEKHGKVYSNKLTRDMSTIEPSDFHCHIPESWIWTELQDLAILFNGKAHEQFVDENGDYILVNSSFVSSEGKVAKNVSSQLTPLTKGNIAIVMSDVPGGKALVKCYLVEEDGKYSLNQRIGGIDTSSHIDIKYLFLVLNRNKYYLQYDDGKKQSNLKKIQILSCPVPLPPIEEQSRIVVKVRELFELCDTLKSKIERTNEINQALSKTVVEVIV